MRGVFVLVILIASAATVCAQALPSFQQCRGDAACEASHQQLRGEAAGARHGDYGAMRNVAFCLWTGCDGAVKIDRKASCQWRRAIMRQHARTVDGGDEAHFARCVSHGY